MDVKENSTIGVKKVLFYCLLFAGLFFLVIPYLLVAFYANPSGDDFSNIAYTIKQNQSTWFMNAIKQSINGYMRWQGTYSGNFFCAFLSGIYHFFGIKWLHVEFAINICVFLFAIHLFYEELLKWRIPHRSSILLLSVAFLVVTIFGCLYNCNVSEVFYWHTGLTVYTIPLSLSIISIGLALSNSGKKRITILSAVMAFISAGGALDIAAFINVGMLLLLLYSFFYCHEYRKQLFLFVVSFFGAVINVVAPGNYNRHGQISSEYPVLDSIKYSFLGTANRNINLIFGVAFPFLILSIIILYKYIAEINIKIINPIILAAFFGIGEAIIDFPVHLGYSDNHMPTRCEFVSRIAMVLFMELWLINSSRWIMSKLRGTFSFSNANVLLIIVVVYTACIPFISDDVSDMFYPFKMYDDLCNGELEKYESANNLILSALENADNEDIVLDIYEWADIDYLRDMRLSSDPDYWVNHETTSYYTNVKSISVNYK